MVGFRQRQQDDAALDQGGRPRRSRQEVNDQFRQYFGELTDENFDYLEFEEEFEDFEPIRQRKRARP